ncbi:alpha/beta hydrolase [Novosphingobium mathurense]|uniref:Acetyl esterase n=1 Tax=Novosphingobium mathurense TaxID=428990 RepID=A0A1U6IJJ0_9SPHN|nr:alpha/beta hydrolase [Novosphingobium mathurense]SLK08160.1 acetyl esterase [Novosphingobium mathurense]
MTDGRIPLDADLAAIVAGLPPPDGTSIFDIPPNVARTIFDAGVVPPDAAAWADSIEEIRDLYAEAEGLTVPIRVYRPKADGPLPLLLFFHGGGFMLGGLDQMDDIARRLCRDVGAVVVSVDYRKAPEHKYPAAADDALAAVRWALRNATSLGSSPERVALVGESSGGNLALTAALQLDASAGRLAALMLIVPGVDLGPVEPDPACPLLAANDMAAISRNYLGADFGRTDRFPPSPLYAEDLSGLPPTVLAIAGHDILAPSNEAFARRLSEAGVTLTVRRFGDMFHPFFGFAGASAGAARAFDTLTGDLAGLLAAEVATPSQGSGI